MEKPKDFLDLSDVSCPICLYVFVKPIRLPCDHRLCGPCFHLSLEHSALSCPLCKKRVGSWARKNKNFLVDAPFWERILREFPREVEARLSGGGHDDYEAFISFPHHQFASSGEISQEFKSQMDEFRKISEDKKLEEEKKSEELISKMLQEEKEEKLREEAKNEALSKDLIQRLQAQEKKSSPNSKKSRQLSLKESLSRATSTFL